jgi:cobalt-zinc-cadmium efflux system protein
MHNHPAASHRPLKRRNLILAILLNFFITAVQVAGGLLSRSLALMSDALHNFSDGMAVTISYIALRIGDRDRTPTKTYGYKRAEILAALLNASVLIVVSVFLFKESIVRLLHPVPVSAGLMMVVAAAGLVANVAAVFLLRGEAKGSLNLRAAYLHLMSDAMTSLAVIFGALLIRFFGFYWVDSVFTIMIGLYVLRGGYSVLREAVDILMQSTPKDIDIRRIKAMVEELPEVHSFHHIHVWRMSEVDIYLEGHVDLVEDHPVSRCGRILAAIDDILKREFRISHSTIQCEYRVCEDGDLSCR